MDEHSVQSAGTCSQVKPMLVQTDSGLALRQGDLQIQGDFSKLAKRIQPSALSRELLVRAARFKNAPQDSKLTAIDATCGLGQDAFLLAASGFEVAMFEHDPTIAALLRDALKRAAESEELAPVSSKMHLVEADSIQGMQTLGFTPDLIYLDPMFPAKRSASSKKKMQLFQMLEAPEENVEALLAAALDAAPRKLVVKRPIKGPCLGGVKPSYSIKGKSVRYDCILPQQLPKNRMHMQTSI